MKLQLVFMSLLTASVLMSCGQAGELEQVQSENSIFVASESVANTDSGSTDIPENNDGETPTPPPTPDLPDEPPVVSNPPPVPPQDDPENNDGNPPIEEIPPVVDNPRNPPGKPPGNPGKPPKADKGPKASGLVECQLGHPNKKVTLGANFEPGSNKQETRVCMSENACLQVVNAYANVRGCSLSLGGATTPGLSGDQCTEIFPGSKGTCKNARALTDAEVTSILTEMAK